MNASPTSACTREPGQWTVIGCLFAAALLAHGMSVANGFIWDDDAYVLNNETLRSVPGLARIWTERGAVPQYYPLVHTTFWIEYHLWGGSPLGYHLVNVLCHGATAAVFYRLLQGLKLPGALLAALLFAVHPLHVESVAWVSERKNVLSGLFYVLSAYSYLKWSGLDAPRPERRAWISYCACVAFYVAALLSKTVTCSLPAAILLVLWWKQGTVSRRQIVTTAPLFVLGILAGWNTASMEVWRVGASGDEFDWSFVERCLIAGRAIWFYLFKLVCPHPLMFVYPQWTIDPRAAGQYVFPVAAVIVTVALALRRGRIGRGPLAAWLLYVGTLFPALGFINVYPMRYSFVADHFAYLASLAPLAAVACGLTGAARRIAGRVASRTWGLAACCLWAGVLTALSIAHTREFRSLETLWRGTLRKNPQAWMASHNLALLLREQGDAHGAEQQFRATLQNRPLHVNARINLGLLLIGEGRLDEAERQFRLVLDIEPDSDEAYNNLGIIFVRRGLLDAGKAAFREALRLRPENRAAEENLAAVLRWEAENAR